MGSLFCCLINNKSKKSSGNYEAAKTEEDKAVDQMSVEDKYLQMEFFAMAKENVPNDQLTVPDFTRLLRFLQYDSSIDALLQKYDKNPQNPETCITCDDYIKFMQDSDAALQKRTSWMRDMFLEFDDNKDCHAFRWQIEQSYEKKGFEIDDEMREKIKKLDENGDGKISYEEFLKSALHKK